MLQSRPQTLVSLVMSLALLAFGISACGGSRSSTALPSAAAQTGAMSRRLHKAGAAAQALTYAQQVLADNPTAYYQMADPATALTDSGTNGLTGVYGSAVVHSTTAITAGALTAAVFPGGASYDAQGYAWVPKSAVLQVAQPTLEAWISLNAPNLTNHDLPIVLYGSVGRGARYGLFIHGLGNGQQWLQFQIRNTGASALIVHSNFRLGVNHIYHVVVSFVGSNVAMYINGVLDAVFSNTGSVDYSTYFTDGLQIGGADQVPAYASASFPGTIAQVAVYAGPLTGDRVVSHYLAGQTLAMTTETPSQADKFVDSIGLNTHFDRIGSVYGTQFTQVMRLLVGSGIRHVRSSVVFNNAAYVAEMKQLAAAGVFGSYVTQPDMTQAQVQQWPSIVAPSFEQYEPPNEQDDVANPNWLPECIAFQENLYSWVKGDALIAKYPVLGPSIVKLQDAPLVGNLSAFMDNGNMHNYFSVFNPGTNGWGGIHPPYGIYGSISYNMNIARVIDGAKPIESTETGYGTIAGNPLTLDYSTHLRYMTRLFFEHFNNGIVRTYSYELVDDGGAAVFDNFGLVTTTLQLKPAYTGIKSLISRLADPGGAFATTPLSYELSGLVDGVHHTLLQKRDGRYVLALWLELPGWVTLNNAGGEITVPPQSVTLTTAKPFSSASIATMDETGTMSSAPLPWNGQSTPLTVSDKVSLVELDP